MKLFTIGFTKKTARRSFEALKSSSAKRVADVRLNDVSRLAGFAKRGDLAYFLKEICGVDLGPSARVGREPPGRSIHGGVP